MWIPKGEAERNEWQTKVERDAKSGARWVAIFIWFAITLLGGGGWFVSLFVGVAIQTHSHLSNALRMLFFGLIAFPFALACYRREWQSHVKEAMNRTVCPKCELFDSGPPGSPCICGGQNVPVGTVKWVEDEPEEDSAESANLQRDLA